MFKEIESDEAIIVDSQTHTHTQKPNGQCGVDEFRDLINSM